MQRGCYPPHVAWTVCDLQPLHEGQVWIGVYLLAALSQLSLVMAVSWTSTFQNYLNVR